MNGSCYIHRIDMKILPIESKFKMLSKLGFFGNFSLTDKILTDRPRSKIRYFRKYCIFTKLIDENGRKNGIFHDTVFFQNMETYHIFIILYFESIIFWVELVSWESNCRCTVGDSEGSSYCSLGLYTNWLQSNLIKCQK